MGPGRGFILTPGLDRAVEIQFPDIKLGEYPSAAEIEARMAPVLAELRREITYTPEFTDIVHELRGHIGAMRRPDAPIAQ